MSNGGRESAASTRPVSDDSSVPDGDALSVPSASAAMDSGGKALRSLPFFFEFISTIYLSEKEAIT